VCSVAAVTYASARTTIALPRSRESRAAHTVAVTTPRIVTIQISLTSHTRCSHLWVYRQPLLSLYEPPFLSPVKLLPPRAVAMRGCDKFVARFSTGVQGELVAYGSRSGAAHLEAGCRRVDVRGAGGVVTGATRAYRRSTPSRLPKTRGCRPRVMSQTARRMPAPCHQPAHVPRHHLESAHVSDAQEQAAGAMDAGGDRSRGACDPRQGRTRPSEDPGGASRGDRARESVHQRARAWGARRCSRPMTCSSR